MNVHRCLLITTGGTIGGKINEDRLHGNVHKLKDFTAIVQPAINDVKEDHGIEVQITDWWVDKEENEHIDVDSSDVNPKHWEQLSSIIYDQYDEFDSFVIAHGTNTLGYTSAALTFALTNINKPVILTGSQVPAGSAGSDAEMNLNNAIRVATFPNSYKGGPLNGVYVVFGSHIISGCRVKKDTEFDYDAFKSFNTGSIGRIGRIIIIDAHNLSSYKDKLTGRDGLATNKRRLILQNKFDMDIASVTEFPGMSSDIFKTLALNGTKGFVLRAFGAGDVSSVHHEVLEFLKEKKIPVIVTTQAPNGLSNFEVNEPGNFLKVHKLAVPAYDMFIESLTVKLAWLLAQNLTYNEVCHKMLDNFHGEVNVIHENL